VTRDTLAGGTAAEALSGGRELASVRVLHVEDRPAFAELTATGLDRADETFEHTHVTDVATAVDRLDDDRAAFDCVVSDYDLPDETGLDLLRTVRRRWPRLPFLLFTGKGSEAVAGDAVAAGADDYLQKGNGLGQFTVLAHRITTAVRRARVQRTLQRAVDAIEATREGVGLVDFDGDGAFFYCNPAYGDLLGYDPEALVGSHWSRIYPSETAAEATAATVAEPLATEGCWNGVTAFARADGTTVELTHRLEYTADGTLICTVSDPGSGRTTAGTDGGVDDRDPSQA